MTQYRVFSIGHSNRTFQEFLELLKMYKIEVLIDIRRYPKSRKFPWFNKEYFQNSLPINGIKYVSFKELGALGIVKDITPFDDIACIKSPTYKSYITYLITSDVAKFYIKKIINFAKEKRISCIMCCERFPWKCHRNFLSDILTILGVKVIHIIDEKRVIEHKGTKCYDYIREKVKHHWNIHLFIT